MQPKDAVKQMMDDTGMSMYAVSLATGHKHSYISSLMRRKGDITSPVLASIANVCGYDLVLQSRDTGKQIVIDGTTSD